VIHELKIPQGIRSLSDYAHEKGMMFGLWFEPEMISPDSDLYRTHPDWCLHVKDRSRTEARNQLVLDLGREEVRNYLFDAISRILINDTIDYVKWDMNRNMTEVGSFSLPAHRQKETSHRYMLGLYDLLNQLISNFPNVLFESCSGGGGRFDPAMLYYMPQTWTSDNTDSFERLKIQWGTSYVYPPVTMGAHVSQIPNHQVMRNTPLHTRANVAMSANLGYELDILKLPEGEKEEVRKQISFYKSIRKTVQFGQFFRLLSPYKDNGTAWMIISDDSKQVLVYYFRHLAIPNDIEKKLHLKYLEPRALYTLEDGRKFYGDSLMYSGLRLPQMSGDFDSVMVVVTKD
jgi:alpha-galactosidase